jgi:hypothetical protein
MKSSIIRGVLLFAAGASCATVAGNWFVAPEISLDDYAALVQKTSRDVAVVGLYGQVTKFGQVDLTTNPAACTPTPQPDIMEGRAVNPVLLERGVRVIESYNAGRVAGVKVGIIVSPPCEPR